MLQTILGPVWQPRILPLILLSASFPTLSGFLTGMCSLWLNWRLKRDLQISEVISLCSSLIAVFPLERFSDFQGPYGILWLIIWGNHRVRQKLKFWLPTTRTQGTNYQKKENSESKPLILAQFPVVYLLTPKLWWAAVYGVAESWTRLKRLSSSSSSKLCRREVSTTNGYLPWALAISLYKD